MAAFLDGIFLQMDSSTFCNNSYPVSPLVDVLKGDIAQILILKVIEKMLLSLYKREDRLNVGNI